MALSKNHVAKIILTLLVIASVAALGSSAQFYREALVDAFFAFALASIVILHFRVCPRRSDLFFLLTIAALWGVFDFRVLSYAPKLMAWFSFLGLASFLIMAIRTIWAEAAERKMLLFAWVPALLFVVSDYFASTMLEWTAAAHPKTLDLYLLSFDSSLRVQLSFMAGRLFLHFPWVRFAALIFYIGLAIPIALVYAGQLIRIRERAFPAMLAFLITGPLGILLYNLFPACGPHYVFSSFPVDPLPLAQVPKLLLEPVAIQGPRNAMPSLHMAWTLLAWWYSRGLSWWERSVAFAFVAFTVLATLGTGEHWFVDLVVAFPFALLIQAICAYPVSWKDLRRVTAFLFGLLGIVTWFAALRYAEKLFWASPVVPWALVTATVLFSCICQSNLAAASAQKPAPSMPAVESLAETTTVGGVLAREPL